VLLLLFRILHPLDLVCPVGQSKGACPNPAEVKPKYKLLKYQ